MKKKIGVAKTGASPWDVQRHSSQCQGDEENYHC